MKFNKNKLLYGGEFFMIGFVICFIFLTITMTQLTLSGIPKTDISNWSVSDKLSSLVTFIGFPVGLGVALTQIIVKKMNKKLEVDK